MVKKGTWVLLQKVGQFGFVKAVRGKVAVVRCDDGVVRYVAVRKLRKMRRWVAV